jgi:phosphoribosylformimino-5-aminoimidazole carboxamide ribotide isomerase
MDKLHLVPTIMLTGGFARIIDPVSLESNFTDPVDLAVELEEIGFDELLIVDIDGAISGKYNSIEILEEIVSYTQFEIIAGGGIRDESTAEKIFNAGASRVLLNTMPVNDPEKMQNLIDFYGNNSFVIGIDINESGIVLEGRKTQHEINLEQLIDSYTEAGIDRFILQPVDESGNKIPPEEAFFEKMMSVFPRIRLYAGEGIKNTDQFDAFEKIGLQGMIIGDEFFTSGALFNELRKYMFA